MSGYVFNSKRKANPVWEGSDFKFLRNSDMPDFHRSVNGYEPTPLIELKNTAAALGVGHIRVKDESRRFGINAFKALGASYAIYRVLKNIWESKYKTGFDHLSFRDKEKLDRLGKFTFCAASDGNHGRAVAWTARTLGQDSVIFMPSTSVSKIIFLASNFEAISLAKVSALILNKYYNVVAHGCIKTPSGKIPFSDIEF